MTNWPPFEAPPARCLHVARCSCRAYLEHSTDKPVIALTILDRRRSKRQCRAPREMEPHLLKMARAGTPGMNGPSPSYAGERNPLRLYASKLSQSVICVRYHRPTCISFRSKTQRTNIRLLAHLSGCSCFIVIILPTSKVKPLSRVV